MFNRIGSLSWMRFSTADGVMKLKRYSPCLSTYIILNACLSVLPVCGIYAFFRNRQDAVSLILLLVPFVVTFAISKVNILVDAKEITYRTILKTKTVPRSKIRRADYAYERKGRGYTPVFYIYAMGDEPALRIPVRLFSLKDATELAQVLGIKKFRNGKSAT